MSDKLYTVSLKGSRGDQPWIVVNADSPQELSGALTDLSENEEYLHSLLQQVADANSAFQAVLNVTTTPAGSGEPAQVAQAATPAPARQDQAPAQGGSSYARRKASAGTGGRGGQPDNNVSPGVTPEPCHHGDRVYRSGNGAKGPWQAWFCPSPKGTPDQCQALWVRD